jgi:hypothetical protein
MIEVAQDKLSDGCPEAAATCLIVGLRHTRGIVLRRPGGGVSSLREGIREVQTGLSGVCIRRFAATVKYPEFQSITID